MIIAHFAGTVQKTWLRDQCFGYSVDPEDLRKYVSQEKNNVGPNLTFNDVAFFMSIYYTDQDLDLVKDGKALTSLVWLHRDLLGRDME